MKKLRHCHPMYSSTTDINSFFALSKQLYAEIKSRGRYLVSGLSQDMVFHVSVLAQSSH